mgnify:CR=1 FL=1
MIIIGEKINGAIPSMAKAIADRDEAWIREIAKKQAEAGADFIDCCASVDENEVETLAWMIDLIQSVTDTPISVDSPSAQACVDAMQYCSRPGLINSVSGEGRKIDIVFPAIADTQWQVMALLCDDTGIPKSAADRIRVLDHVMARAKEYGIAQSRIHIDPLVEMLCTAEDGISVLLEVMAYTKEHYPGVHLSGAISNISYNLPYRKIVNIAFAVLCVNAGMDSAVLDPLNRDLRGAIYATEALKGDDFYCMEYISAYREGIFGPAK